MSRYTDFIVQAEEALGLSYLQARDLYGEMKDALGYGPGPEDVYEYADIAEALIVPTPMEAFEQFAEEAHERWGLSENDAADLLDTLEGEGYDYHPGAPLDIVEAEFSDVLGDFDISEYELDPDWPDDDWLDPGDWYEVTGEYEET